MSSGPAQRPPSFGGRGVAPPVHAARPIPGSPGRPSVGSGWSGGSEPGYGYRGGFRGDRARGGRWFHGHHGDRLGWWLIYGDTWYPYAYPFSPYLEAAPSAPSDYWYWCESAQAYYPYVRVCPEGWELVVPSPQPDDWP